MKKVSGIVIFCVVALFGDSCYAKESIKIVKKAHRNTTKYILKKRESVGKGKKKRYAEAKRLFQNKNYEKAYEVFKALYLKDMQNPSINFYLGLSAFWLGKYEEAIAAFERVTMINPKAYRAKLEAARAYYRLGMLKKAKSLFLSVKDKVPKSVQKNIDKYLLLIEKGRKKHFFSGTLIAGVNYDSNIYNVAVDNVLSDKIPNYKINNTAKSGWAAQEVLSTSYAYAYTNTVRFKADTLLFNKNIFKYHDMDIALLMFTPAVSVSYKNTMNVDFALFANKIWLAKKHLMYNYGVNPKIGYRISPTLLIKAALLYQIQENNDANKARDNTTYGLELGVAKNLKGNLSLNLKTTFNAVREKKRNEAKDLNEVAYNLYELTLGANYKFSPKIIASTKLKGYEKRYQDKSLSPITKQELYKRVDNEYQIVVSGMYVFATKFLFSLEYTHIKHDSNYVDNVFDKDTFAVNMIIPF